MTIQQVMYALTIEEYGSMNKAAEKLYIVQPTLTSAIQELENEVGITIFMRTNKGVIVTPEGEEFLNDIRGLYHQYENVLQKYAGEGTYKRKFGVSTQHYSFAVKAFIEMAKQYDMNEFDFAIRETRTRTIINDVGSLKSEIGVIYRSAHNEKMLNKLLSVQGLEFTPLVQCYACVYLWAGHPLAKEKYITFDMLEPYPCFSFEQNEDSDFLDEEILGENDYAKKIKVTDRQTMLDLLVGLNGYTLCSGIFAKEATAEDYVVVPYKEDEENPNSLMEIGYITKKNTILSKVGEKYIEELKSGLESLDVVVID